MKITEIIWIIIYVTWARLQIELVIQRPMLTDGGIKTKMFSADTSLPTSYYNAPVIYYYINIDFHYAFIFCDSTAVTYVFGVLKIIDRERLIKLRCVTIYYLTLIFIRSLKDFKVLSRIFKIYIKKINDKNKWINRTRSINRNQKY